MLICCDAYNTYTNDTYDAYTHILIYVYMYIYIYIYMYIIYNQIRTSRTISVCFESSFFKKGVLISFLKIFAGCIARAFVKLSR